MTGCWRLLVAFALVFVWTIFVWTIFVALIFVAPTRLLGQDMAADRSPAGTSAVAPVLPSNSSPLRPSSPIAPVWIPPPSLPRSYPTAPGDTAFQHLVRAAGIIFSGRVVFIGRAGSSPGSSPDPGPNPASATVTFQVEHALRGVSPGQKLTIHEWGGLRASGQRYYVGEHLLLFLYSPSRLGLTSPVAGTMGRFAMDSQGRIVMSAQHIAVLAADLILGGRTVVPYADFARAVRRSSGEE